MRMWETCCAADDMQAVGGQSGLIPFLTVSCFLLKHLVHQNTVLWLGATSPHTQLPADVSGQHTFLPQETSGPSFSTIFSFQCPWQLTTNWCNCPAKKEPMAPSATTYCVNVQLPLPHNMCTFVCLGISVYTLQRVSNMYEQPCIYILYFPAHKTHFFPWKMWPKFKLHLMRHLLSIIQHLYRDIVKFASKLWDLASLLVNGLLSYPRIYPNVYIASQVTPGVYTATVAKCSKV